MLYKTLVAGAALGLTIPSLAAAQDTPAWTPLATTKFGEELTSIWVPVPNGTSGAPRQGWLATADGFFTREAHLAYSYTDRRNAATHEVLARLHYPFSRRFWAGVTVPFYQSTRGRDAFGDPTLTTQIMVTETRNLSVNAGVGWRLPLGSASSGNKVFAAQPQVNLWSDVGHGFSLRGRVAYEFANRNQGEAVSLNAAIGQTVTAHDKAPVGDLTWYVAGNLRAPTRGPAFVSITPGARTHLGGNLFLLAGVEIPVANARATFRERLIVQLVQGF